MRIPGLVLAAFFTLASCSDDAAPEDGGGLGTPEQVSAFVTDLCALYEPCCATGESSKDACVSAVQARGAGLTLDTARATACLDAVRAAAKTSSFCLEGPATSACGAVFKRAAAGAEGSSCQSSSDCANGDGGDALCVSGKCREVVGGKEGDACIATRVGKSTEKLTTVPAGTVAVCDASDGLYCAESTGKCTPRASVGSECEGSDVSCVDVAYCPVETSRCTPRTAAGQPCEDPYECAAGASCASDDEGGSVCVASVGEGGACERGDECGDDLVCDSSTTCVEDSARYQKACTGALALTDLL